MGMECREEMIQTRGKRGGGSGGDKNRVRSFVARDCRSEFPAGLARSSRGCGRMYRSDPLLTVEVGEEEEQAQRSSLCWRCVCACMWQ